MIKKLAVICAIASFACLTGCATYIPAEVRSQLAPTGVMRVGLNLSTTLLAKRDSASGELRGVAIDIANELGRRLEMQVQFVAYATGELDKAIGKNEWDVAFFAIEPTRAQRVSFSPPYAEIETSYLVKKDALMLRAQDVDREGLTVAVSRGAGYESMLAGLLKHSKLLRTSGFADSIRQLNEAKVNAIAGLKPDLIAYAAKQPGFRVVDGKFGAVEQGIGIQRGMDAAAQYLRTYVTDLKQSGFVSKSIASNNASGLTVPQ